MQAVRDCRNIRSRQSSLIANKTDLSESAKELNVDWLNNDPEDLCCSITLDLYVDPVIASDGFTYERAAIERVIQTQGTSPNTREKLFPRLFVNRAKLTEVAAYRTKKASECVQQASQCVKRADYVLANLMIEKAVQLKGGNASLHRKWITILRAMGMQSRALHVQFLLAKKHFMDSHVEDAISVYEDILDSHPIMGDAQIIMPITATGGKDPALPAGIMPEDHPYPQAITNVTASPLLLHVTVAERLLPLYRIMNNRAFYRELLVSLCQEVVRCPDLEGCAVRVEGLLIVGMSFLGESHLLWSTLAELQIFMGRTAQAGSSYVNAARCCGLRGETTVAEWYLTRAADVGNVQGMLALIELLREKEEGYKQVITNQQSEIANLKQLLEKGENNPNMTNKLDVKDAVADHAEEAVSSEDPMDLTAQSKAKASFREAPDEDHAPPFVVAVGSGRPNKENIPTQTSTSSTIQSTTTGSSTLTISSGSSSSSSSLPSTTNPVGVSGRMETSPVKELMNPAPSVNVARPQPAPAVLAHPPLPSGPSTRRPTSASASVTSLLSYRERRSLLISRRTSLPSQQQGEPSSGPSGLDAQAGPSTPLQPICSNLLTSSPSSAPMVVGPKRDEDRNGKKRMEFADLERNDPSTLETTVGIINCSRMPCAGSPNDSQHRLWKELASGGEDVDLLSGSFRSYRSRWLAHAQSSANGLQSILISEIMKDEEIERKRIFNLQAEEWERLLFVEEESFTRSSVRVLERAYSAYRFRRSIDARARNRRTSGGGGRPVIKEEGQVSGAAAPPSEGNSSNRPRAFNRGHHHPPRPLWV